MKNSYKEILDHINGLNIIDTHEHLPSKEEDRDKDADVLKEYLSNYFHRDLISAGLSLDDYGRIMEKDLSIMDKWKIVEPYWMVSRHTGYCRALDIAARDIHGVERIDASTIEELNKKFLNTLKPGYFKNILKDKCRIETSLLNVETLSDNYDPSTERSIYCDRDLFSPVYMLTGIIFPLVWDDIRRVEEGSGIRITSFSKYLEATEILIEKAYEMGVIALKNQLAYIRTLKYERVNRTLAEDEFYNIFKTKHIPDWHERQVLTGQSFQDHMFHFILDIANKKNLIIQIHTGLQEGNGNILSNSNPVLLSNLFLEYPDINFDIFHMSYPFQDVLTVLSKNYSNVFIDMCWAHIVSPNASINALLEWFDTVPLNKVSAFGGDYEHVDGVYGHLKIAQQNIAIALSIKVDQKLFDIDEAKKIAVMLFYDNPKKLFRI